MCWFPLAHSLAAGTGSTDKKPQIAEVTCASIGMSWQVPRNPEAPELANMYRKKRGCSTPKARAKQEGSITLFVAEEFGLWGLGVTSMGL